MPWRQRAPWPRAWRNGTGSAWRAAILPIHVGIGVHWGPVVLGDIGGENRLEFATIGDTVNVASRLEHMTRELAAEVAASHDLVEALRASLSVEEAEALLEGFVKSTPQAVRGRVAQLEIFCRPRG